MKFKIVFLDIDGVLNRNRGPAKALDSRQFPFDCLILKDRVAILNQLAARDVRFVISSDWAKVIGPKATACALASHGFSGRYLFPEDLGMPGPTKWELGEENALNETLMTPRVFSRHRGQEINLFLEKYQEYIENFVIIDDSVKISSHLQSNFVFINDSTGLEIHHIEAALKVLGLD